MPFTTKQKLNITAISCFRDTADGDYINARAAHRVKLPSQFLWASEQTIEKYLKCILMLRGVPAKHLGHNLDLALDAVNRNVAVLPLSTATKEFIEHVDNYGPDRYLVGSFHTFGADVWELDRAVWEVRRYCKPSDEDELKKIVEHHRTAVEPDSPKERVTLPGGFLEKVLSNPNHPARSAFLWQNAFFGRKRRPIRPSRISIAVNSPLFLFPEIVEEVDKLVYLPSDAVEAYQTLAKQNESKKALNAAIPR